MTSPLLNTMLSKWT